MVSSEVGILAPASYSQPSGYRSSPSFGGRMRLEPLDTPGTPLGMRNSGGGDINNN